MFSKRQSYLETMNSNAPKAMIARLKSPSGPANAAIAKGKKQREKLQMHLYSLGKYGLDSSLKEVRVFKVELPAASISVVVNDSLRG